MVIFDLGGISIRKVLLKSCTTALGGSVTVVDEDRTEKAGKEIFTKLDVPMALVRTFQSRHKMSRYLKPVPTTLVYYQNNVIAMERHPLGTLGEMVSETYDGRMVEWQSECERNLREFVGPMIVNGGRQWFIDGKFIYSFPKDLIDCVVEGEFLSADGKFRAIDVDVIKLADLDDRTKIAPNTRTCLAFVSSTGEFAVTPPIWKNVSNVGASATKKIGGDDDNEKNEKTFQFDVIDQYLNVNLNFALKAGKEIGELLGYEAIEPLQLPKLMIQLSTVNLPNVPNAVKSTYDVGMSFTHAIAWLIGISTRVDTLEAQMAVRSLLKYLTTKGIFRASLFTPEHIFKKGSRLDDVKMKTKEEAVEHVDNMPFNVVTELLTTTSRTKKEGNVIGGILATD